MSFIDELWKIMPAMAKTVGASVKGLPKYLFRGQELYRIGDALTTKESYENGLVSFAHVFGNEIRRYGEVIGTTDELVPVQGEPNAD